ncbi:MAG: DUF2911 domain-containing protein [Ignavibacterium sp.]
MKQLFIFVLICIGNILILPQEILTPRLSPLSEISQFIGISKVTIKYSRPAVRNRVIWDSLVPYNQVWRTGANENTTITFSHPVLIDGNLIDKGTYGIYTIPNKNEWIIIFSKDNNLWGSDKYNQANDALRINAKPQTNEFTDRLTFDFQDVTDSSAFVILKWEKVKVAFPIQFDTKNLVLNNIKDKFNWSLPNTAATYILNNQLDYNEGLKFVNQSIMIEENYSNLKTKARLLEKLNQKSEAIKTMEKAIQLGKQMKTLPFDLTEMENLLQDWKK